MPNSWAPVKHKWVVFVASVVVAFFNFGLVSSMGALYKGMLDTFNAGRARTALVQSLLFTFCWTFGVVSGFLITKFGVTVVTYIAAILTAAGFFASFFATSIYQLYGFISVVTGMGFATMYISAVVCVGWTFAGRQKSMVLALQSVGTAVSGFMWPSLLTSAIEAYSMRGTYLILCGIFLNNVPLAMIFSNCDIKGNQQDRPISKHGETNEGYDHSDVQTPHSESAQTKNTDSTNDSENRKCKITNTTCNAVKRISGELSKTPSKGEKEVNDTYSKAGCTSKSVEIHGGNAIVDPDIHNSEYAARKRTNNINSVSREDSVGDRPNFTETCFSRLWVLYGIYVVAGVLNMSSLAGFLTIYQDINIYTGLTISQSDITFMSYAFLNIASRFLPLIPARFSSINSFAVPIFSSACGGIGQLILLTNTSFLSTIIAMAITAISDGGWVASMQAIVFEILPQEYQATGFGFMLTAMGVLASATGPIFGAIRDETSSYQAVLITTTTMLFTSALLELVCLFLTLRSKQRKYTLNS